MKPETSGHTIRFIGYLVVPSEAVNMLRLGPKFCTQPKVGKCELLSLVRRMAVKASSKDFSRRGLALVEGLPQSLQGTIFIHKGRLVESLVKENMQLLSNTEGSFALTQSKQYKRHFSKSICKSF